MQFPVETESNTAFEPSVVFQVNRDAGRPPGVTSDGGEKTRCFGPLPRRADINTALGKLGLVGSLPNYSSGTIF